MCTHHEFVRTGVLLVALLSKRRVHCRGCVHYFGYFDGTARRDGDERSSCIMPDGAAQTRSRSFCQDAVRE